MRKVSNILIILLFLLKVVIPNVANASQEEIDKLNQQINQNKDRIANLDKEIEAQRAALNSASGRANNLQSTIKVLEATKAKLQKDVERTTVEIARAELTIKRLDLEILEKEHYIKKNSDGLGESIRKVNALEKISTFEKFLQFKSLSDFWSDLESTSELQRKLSFDVENLKRSHSELKLTQDTKLAEKENLAKQKTILAGETEVVKSTQEEKNELLKRTKSEESEYQRLLNIKINEKRAFEEELTKIESKLNYLIDPKSLPKAARGVLGWPVDIVRITQYFGGTSFARSNPKLYGGTANHNGVDFGVPVGTKVKAAESGVVMGFDNTDAYPGCRSWGRWLLIKYDNGLSTLYAHLSGVLVSQGQRVSRGEAVALSGNTGVSTGPHLHMSVYASQGVRIGKYKDIVNSGGGCSLTQATSPFASLDAYYDPMSYLPSV